MKIIGRTYYRENLHNIILDGMIEGNRVNKESCHVKSREIKRNRK